QGGDQRRARAHGHRRRQDGRRSRRARLQRGPAGALRGRALPARHRAPRAQSLRRRAMTALPDLDAYVATLRRGGVVACPTETLQGLLADARSEAAVQRVVELKRRGPEPIAVIVPSLFALDEVAEPPSEQALALARRHWPGPLTLVLRARSGLPAPLVRQGTIGVRVPGPSPALALVQAFGGPLTATSANPSGLPP